MKNKRLSTSERQRIINKYKTGKYTQKELGLEYGVSGVAIGNLLRKNNISIIDPSILRKKYKLNENYFNKIDTEEKAYFLGLLYADGYNNTDKYAVVLALQKRDKDILNTLRKAIGTNKPLWLSPRNNPNHQDIYICTICSKQISRDLNRLGCIKTKSLVLEFPTHNQVPTKLIRHFIRGYFDGDGCISVQQNFNQLKIFCNLTSTESFCKSLQNILKSLGIFSKLYTRFPERKTSTRQLVLTRQKDIKKFLRWIYNKSAVSLCRKYKLYQKICG